MEKSVKDKLLKGFDDIFDDKRSVTLLCEKSGVSRGTFYLYYRDLEDFEIRIGNEIMQKFIHQVIDIIFCSDDELAEKLKEKNFLLNKTERSLFYKLGNSFGYLNFVEKKNEEPIELLKNRCKKIIGEDLYEKHEFKLEFFLNGVSILLFLSLIDYDESKVLFEMRESRRIIKTLFD